MKHVQILAGALALTAGLALACGHDGSATSGASDTTLSLSALEAKVKGCADAYGRCDAGADCAAAMDTCSDEAVKQAGSAAAGVKECTGALKLCLGGDAAAKDCVDPFHSCMEALAAARDAAVDHDADSDESHDGDVDSDESADADVESDESHDADVESDESTDGGMDDEGKPDGGKGEPGDGGCKGKGKGNGC
jgi:hypothetical protein